MQVASLQTENVCIKEQLKSLSDKNQELTADRQKLNEQNNMLIKCVAELSADKLTHIPLTPVEQVT